MTFFCYFIKITSISELFCELKVYLYNPNRTINNVLSLVICKTYHVFILINCYEIIYLTIRKKIFNNK